jgi:hypothetical protein
MPDLITRNRERVKQAIDYLAVNRRPVTIRMVEEQAAFQSLILRADHRDPASQARTPGRVYIHWLSPPEGNNLIQSAKTVEVRFSIGKYGLAFASKYVTKSLEPPYLGHIITYPESLIIADRRRHDRHEVGSKTAPLFAKAKIRVREGGSQENVYDLRVFDVSENGVGMLVGEELFNWLERIGIGDRLKGLELSAPWTIVKVDGTVRHKSKMRRGRYSSFHLLGIELDEKLEHYA